jgi:hypothetical protein
MGCVTTRPQLSLGHLQPLDFAVRIVFHWRTRRKFSLKPQLTSNPCQAPRSATNDRGQNEARRMIIRSDQTPRECSRDLRSNKIAYKLTWI